jgi:hypothetical protein
VVATVETTKAAFLGACLGALEMVRPPPADFFAARLRATLDISLTKMPIYCTNNDEKQTGSRVKKKKCKQQ